MRSDRIEKHIVAGIAAGLVLGFFLKIMQSLTGLEVYILLLNVDYVPILNRWVLPEWGEFAIHLVISVFLSLALYFYQNVKRLSFRWIVIFSLVIGLLLYPTTLLSDRTPEINSINAFLIWMAGHGLYGATLALMVKKPSEPAF